MLRDVLRLQIDLGLTIAELGWNMAMPRSTINSICKQGDGAQPVILIPGFNAPERSLGHLTRFLNQNGFDAHGWGLGTNSGPSATGFDIHIEELAEQLRPRVRALADLHGRGVALVGHSLGGVCARELAMHLQPDIDRVITLGAPTFPRISLERHNSILQMIGERQMKVPMKSVFVDAGTRHWPANKPNLPCVAIISPIDAAVSEQYALIPQSIVHDSRAPAIRENVRIVASHGGMGVNPRILLAVADRLCADPNNWKPFDHSSLRALLPFRRQPVTTQAPGI